MDDVMSTLLFVLVVWLLASISFGLCVGRFCSLNQMPFDDDAAHIARGSAAQRVGNETRASAPSSALRTPVRI